MKVVILCGGKGTRLREQTEALPKPMIEIGDKPILEHIMEIFSVYGFREFVLCLGYKAPVIRDYFVSRKIAEQKSWKIDFADTGEETQTGGRIKRVEPLITGENFMATYGDGLADIDIKKLVEFHLAHGKIGTLTAVNPPSQFGLLDLKSDGQVSRFQEKPPLDHWINGGFFVFKKEFFGYLGENDILEKAPLEKLSHEGALMAYRHQSFWKCMDTYKDSIALNELWNSGKAPWRKA